MGTPPRPEDLFEFSVVSHQPFTVRWPEGIEVMDQAVHFSVRWNGQPFRVSVGRVTGGRDAFGRNRERVHVVVENQVRAEFVETDEYESTRELVCVLKRPGGNVHAQRESEVPEDYRNFRLERFSELIRQKGTYKGLAVVVSDTEHQAMATYGLLRWRDRKAGR